MIRRPSGSEFLLIEQAQHAALSGAFAAALGNAQFEKFLPEGPTLLAIAQHDAGWPLHDQHPTINAQGLPLHVFETPPELGTHIWTLSTELAVAQNPLAGLLVSIHGLTLSDIAQQHGFDPNAPAHTPAETFALMKFQHKQVEIQELLRRRLGMATDVPLRLGLADLGTNRGDDRLRFSYRWLAAMDRLSLELCCGKPLFTHLVGVHPRSGEAAIDLKIIRLSDTAVSLDPWPFSQSELTYSLPARRVRGTPYDSDTALAADYAVAPVELLSFTVRKAAEV